ncbi:GntR family transcriptional regulator [Pusillimonas caeni]|uniref:GntR family transcriptional regulator n=1 Tax=Pusillimonas caeni TaxID=1348472 RepID=UPI000E59E5A7|nr:GntR family transcriptional regulator [Pusillimonas caeni]TFL13341.1 GntR family transcriptional regulator [Pusillimonas caeni]
MPTLDPASSSGLPLYKEVKRQIVQALSVGEWKPGDMIPSEKQLCARFGVSIGTLRKAIDELVSENILVRHQGRGTFVAVHNRGPRLFRFFNLIDSDGQRTYPQLEIVGFSKGRADRTVAAKLGIAVGTRTYRIATVRSIDGKPLLIEDITLSQALFPDLTAEKVHRRPSTLYNLYQVAYGINVVRIEEGVQACIAEGEHARRLGVEPGLPLLQVRRVAYSYNDQPVEYRVSHIDSRHHEYFRAVS